MRWLRYSKQDLLIQETNPWPRVVQVFWQMLSSGRSGETCNSALTLTPRTWLFFLSLNDDIVSPEGPEVVVCTLCCTCNVLPRIFFRWIILFYFYLSLLRTYLWDATAAFIDGGVLPGPPEDRNIKKVVLLQLMQLIVASICDVCTSVLNPEFWGIKTNPWIAWAHQYLDLICSFSQI